MNTQVIWLWTLVPNTQLPKTNLVESRDHGGIWWEEGLKFFWTFVKQENLDVEQVRRDQHGGRWDPKVEEYFSCL